MQLSDEQLSNYARNGYLLLPDFVDHSECVSLRSQADQLVERFDPKEATSIFSTHEQSRTTDSYFLESGDKIRFFFEEDAFAPDGTLRQSKERSINKIGHALHDLDKTFNDFSRSAKIESLVSALKIQDPLLVQSMYIFKQPNIGGEVTCHQDCTFIHTDPLSTVGLWFALEDATVENGCLWAIPAGHRRGLKSLWVRASAETMGFQTLDEQPWDEEKLTPLEVKKGTLIVLHGLLPHKSLANKSSKSRHAYTLHVISSGSQYSKENWLQRPASFPFRGFD